MASTLHGQAPDSTFSLSLLSSLTEAQNPYPLHWECRVLSTGHWGSPYLSLLPKGHVGKVLKQEVGGTVRLWLCQQEQVIPLSLSLSIWKMGIITAFFFFFLPMDLQGVVRGLWHHQRQRELSGAHAQPHPGFLLLRGHGAPSQPEPK